MGKKNKATKCKTQVCMYTYIYMYKYYTQVSLLLLTVSCLFLSSSTCHIYIFRTGPCLVQALGSQDLVAGDVVHRVVALTTNHQTIAIPRRVGWPLYSWGIMKMDGSMVLRWLFQRVISYCISSFQGSTWQKTITHFFELFETSNKKYFCGFGDPTKT
jgi:hypothetical protein